MSEQITKVQKKITFHLDFLEIVQTLDDKMKSYVKAIKVAYISLLDDREKIKWKNLYRPKTSKFFD